MKLLGIILSSIFTNCILSICAFADVLYSQNFDDALLNRPISETDPDPKTNDWTKPENSGLAWTRGDDKAIGGTPEWLGWSFVTTNFWIKVSQDQERSKVFASSTKNVIAVADSDEAEDGGATPEDGFNTFLRTPPIDLKSCDLSELKIGFDSSFRKQENEEAHVRFFFDNREPVIFEIPDQGTKLTPILIGYNDLNKAPTKASKLVIEFAHIKADNNWWWAIDNLVVSCGKNKPSNSAPKIIAQQSGPSSGKTGDSYNFEFKVSDPENDSVQISSDWGDGSYSTSGFDSAKNAFAINHIWKRPGDYPIKLRAVDKNGSISEWVTIQSVKVTGEPIIKIVTPPYLQNAGTDRIVIMTESSDLADLMVAYSKGDSLDKTMPMVSVHSGGGTYFHRALISGLEPGTHYHYQIRSIKGTPYSKVSHFDTAPDSEVDFKFSVWSDSQGHNRGAWSANPLEPTISMMKHMVNSGVAFGLTSGDLAEDGASYDDTRRFYLDRVAYYLGTSVPWYAAWGNHDASDPKASLRLASDMPSRFRAGYSPGHGSFTFTYSNCFYVCIDHISQNVDISSGWLEKQLSSPKAVKARFRFVAIHVPPFCERWIDGSAFLRNELVPLLEKYNVNFCFSGHTHEYERGELNHVHYVLSGGGAWLDHGEPIIRDWEHMIVGGAHDVKGGWAKESAPGVLGKPKPIIGGLFNQYSLVTIRDKHLLLESIGFNADGSEIGVLDRVELNSKPKGDIGEKASSSSKQKTNQSETDKTDPFDNTIEQVKKP